MLGREGIHQTLYYCLAEDAPEFYSQTRPCFKMSENWCVCVLRCRSKIRPPLLSASQKESQIFPPTTGGAEAMCQDLKIPLLGKVPLDPHIGKSEHGSSEGLCCLHSHLSSSELVCKTSTSQSSFEAAATGEKQAWGRHLRSSMKSQLCVPRTEGPLVTSGETAHSAPVLGFDILWGPCWVS